MNDAINTATAPAPSSSPATDAAYSSAYTQSFGDQTSNTSPAGKPGQVAGEAMAPATSPAKPATPTTGAAPTISTAGAVTRPAAEMKALAETLGLQPDEIAGMNPSVLDALLLTTTPNAPAGAAPGGEANGPADPVIGELSQLLPGIKALLAGQQPPGAAPNANADAFASSPRLAALKPMMDNLRADYGDAFNPLEKALHDMDTELATANEQIAMLPMLGDAIGHTILDAQLDRLAAQHTALANETVREHFKTLFFQAWNSEQRQQDAKAPMPADIRRTAEATASKMFTTTTNTRLASASLTTNSEQALKGQPMLGPTGSAPAPSANRPADPYKSAYKQAYGGG